MLTDHFHPSAAPELGPELRVAPTGLHVRARVEAVGEAEGVEAERPRRSHRQGVRHLEVRLKAAEVLVVEQLGAGT